MYQKNPFIRFGFNHRSMKDISISRQERIKKDGSEYFTWIYPVTAATVTSSINVGGEFPRARKYMPLDWLEIANNDAVDITVVLNGGMGDSFYVPAGTIRVVDGRAFGYISVTNDDAILDSVLSAIILTMRRKPITIDDWARGNR